MVSDLNIGGNDIGVEGARLIAAALESPHNKLTTLSL
jgi:hypothetical protein